MDNKRYNPEEEAERNKQQREDRSTTPDKGTDTGSETPSGKPPDTNPGDSGNQQ